MGLDMYFFTMPGDADEKSVKNFIDDDSTELNDFYYFRKHPDLHGWLRDKWVETHMNSKWDAFNFGEALQITRDLLDELEAYARKGECFHYSGFFWGESTPEKWEHTLQEFLPLAREKLEAGESVWYTSSW